MFPVNVPTLILAVSNAFTEYDKRKRKERLAAMSNSKPKLPDAEGFANLKSANPDKLD